MSAQWVVDASVGLAWVRSDQATPETDGLLRDSITGHLLVVPVHRDVWEIGEIVAVLD